MPYQEEVLEFPMCNFQLLFCDSSVSDVPHTQAEDHSGAPAQIDFPERDHLRVRPPCCPGLVLHGVKRQGFTVEKTGIRIADIRQPTEDFYLPHTSWKSLEVKLNWSSSNTFLILIFLLFSC